ncbi:MAG: hypothetical protein JST04_07680 [Bdellovibrionales bacterium]|nr:hypothetical protein [Bdellovibrionales bacterium]
MCRERPIFTPSVFSNQVKVVLFVGVASILLPFFLSESHAEPAAMDPPAATQSEPAAPPSDADPDSGSGANPIDDGAFHAMPDADPMVARIEGNARFSWVALAATAP